MGTSVIAEIHPVGDRHRRGNGRIAIQGFTLVELIVTMLIVGIMGVFVAGRMDSFSAFGEKGLHDSLKAGLQFARKAAVAKRRNVCVATAGGTATFTIDTRPPETAAAVFCDGSSEVNLNLPSRDRNCPADNQICAPTGMTASCAPATFQFDALGRASAAVACASTGQPNIAVTQETGYVH